MSVAMDHSSSPWPLSSVNDEHFSPRNSTTEAFRQPLARPEQSSTPKTFVETKTKVITHTIPFYELASKENIHNTIFRRNIRKDKLSFVFGVIHFWIYAYWLGSSPSTFYKLYSVEAIVLFPLRWKSFKKHKKHYYMFDFCYLANLFLLVYVWFFPNSNFLYKTQFAYNSGPLAGAILLFKNSVVYHDLAEVTTLFMHWSPMMVAWTLRWYPDYGADMTHGTTHTDEAWMNADVSQLLFWPLLPYFGWAVLYYLKLFVVSSKKIHDRGYCTLYKYMLEEANFTPLKRFVFRFSPRWRPLVYMGIHLSMVFVSLSTCILWWNSFWAHTSWVITATLVSTWNGASHYFQ